MRQKKVGVILSGCGVQDGAEIHESVLTLLALDKADVQTVCMAPNRDQMHVIDHTTGDTMSESRNVLVEAARIARGEISDMASVDPSTLDAVVLPGGFGAAKNLCTFAVEGADCSVDPQVERVVRAVHAAGKPVVAVCISPAILAAVFGKELHPTITIGTDAGTAEALEKMGARHQSAATTEVIVDDANNLITTPCYMSATRIRDVATGIDNAISELLKRMDSAAHSQSV